MEFICSFPGIFSFFIPFVVPLKVFSVKSDRSWWCITLNSKLNTQCIAVLSTKVLYSWVKCIGDDQVLVSGKVEHIVGQERIVGEWQWEGAVTRQWENKATDSTRWPSSTFPHSVFTQNWVEPKNASNGASFPPQIHLAEQELFQEILGHWMKGERSCVNLPRKILFALIRHLSCFPCWGKKKLCQPTPLCQRKQPTPFFLGDLVTK